MKVKKLKATMGTSQSLPRIAKPPAGDGAAPSPFSSSTPTATPPRAAASYGGCMATPTDTPPHTPTNKTGSIKGLSGSSSYGSLWSPRKLMQRAARAFRGSSGSGNGGGRSSRRRSKFAPAAGEELQPVDAGKVGADAAAPDYFCHAATELARRDKAAEEDPQRPADEDEVVPEKIIHEANHHHHHQQLPAAAAAADPEEVCDKIDTAEEEPNTAASPAPEEEEPKKQAASPPPEKEEDDEDLKKAVVPSPPPEPVAYTANAKAFAAAIAEADVADKFVTVVKEAIRRQEEEEEEAVASAEVEAADTKKEATKRFLQGRRVRTAMEARAESELPRCREAARSNNDVIEEARSRLLELRQLSRVKALVGAFETVMVESKQPATPKTTTTQHHQRMTSA